MYKKLILVTWWTWYIWSHWVVAFEQAWYKTVIVDNLCNSHIWVLNWIEKILGYKPDFYEVDLRYKNKLEKVFKSYNFDCILHFAWLKCVWESCKEPLKYFDNNIVWSIKLFECMKKFWVKDIIFSSSATVYKELKNENWKIRGFREDDLVWDCLNPYGTSKFLLENILRDLTKFSWFRIINLRYFNPIWAHESGFIWENPKWIPNNLIPFIMKVATWELERLKIFWDDYDTIDGTWVRDYIDVCDLIEGHLKAYERLKKSEKWMINSGAFETYNLWIGNWVSVLEMLEIVIKVTWKKIPYKIVWRRDGDLAEVFCNPKRAETDLWWNPKISLEKSLENSWRFYNK